MGKYKFKLKENPLKVGQKTVDKDVQSTVSDIDPTTGSVTWDIKDLPSIRTVFKKFKELNNAINTLDKDTDDETIDEINSNIRVLFNQYRTHIRNNYSDTYNSAGLKETPNPIKEMSTTGGGAAGDFLPKASNPIKKKFKYKLKEEPDNSRSIFQKKRIDAFNKLEGRLIEIKKKLRQAKLSTIKHYNTNPGDWSVVYGTDLIDDYFNDIENLLSDNKE